MILEFQDKRIPVSLTTNEQDMFSPSSPYVREESGDIVIDKSFFVEQRRVRDAYRYDLRCLADTWRLTRPSGGDLGEFAGNEHDQDPGIQEGKIVLLLESPHKDEYTTQGAQGPALGTSGRNIHCYFANRVLPVLVAAGLRLGKKRCYQLCIANPVQFQASLVDIHKDGLVKSIRDKVWEALWPECRCDFEKRLHRYEPSIILNGCTSSLKAHLRGVISSMSSVQSFEVTHPASWQQCLAGFKKA